MARYRMRQMLTRQWALVRALASSSRGRTVTQLASMVGASRATVFRDLAVFGEVQMPIGTEQVNGEVRYRMVDDGLPALRPTPKQFAALMLLRNLATPLEGTGLVRELDGLLTQLARELRGAPPPDGATPHAPGRVQACADSASRDGQGADTVSRCVTGRSAAHRTVEVEMVRAVDHAIEQGTKVELVYRGAGAKVSSRRVVDPVQWRLCEQQLYLIAFDDTRSAWRTFKAGRIEAVQLMTEKASRHDDFDEEAMFGRSVRIWSGPTVDVAVRLSARVARFAAEWPLSQEQTVEVELSRDHGPGPNGTTDRQSAPPVGAEQPVVVRAKVAGTVEAMRWVLGWGREAEALSPPELRRRVAEEVAAATLAYCDSTADRPFEPAASVMATAETATNPPVLVGEGAAARAHGGVKKARERARSSDLSGATKHSEPRRMVRGSEEQT